MNRKMGKVLAGEGSTDCGPGKSANFKWPKANPHISQENIIVKAKRSGNTPQKTAHFKLKGFRPLLSRFLFTALYAAPVQRPCAKMSIIEILNYFPGNLNEHGAPTFISVAIVMEMKAMVASVLASSAKSYFVKVEYQISSCQRQFLSIPPIIQILFRKTIPA